jgi:hypothetical protein
LGFPPLRDALPNTTHFALAALQHASVVSQLITQNVDGLHLKALAHIWNPSRIQEKILELHGTLHVLFYKPSYFDYLTHYQHRQRVRCKHGHVIDRETFQEWLSASNQQWKQFMDDVERTGNHPRTNPDGDARIHLFNLPWPLLCCWKYRWLWTGSHMRISWFQIAPLVQWKIDETQL